MGGTGFSMIITKILNNNHLLIDDHGVPKVVMGLGIGYKKKVSDPVDQDKVEKVFVMTDNSEYKKFQEILMTLPEEHIQVAETIINYAEDHLHTVLNEHIHVALMDHLSFAIERISSGINLHNELLEQIKSLYPEEFAVGLWAREFLKRQLDVDMPEDEAGYIALHIRTARMGLNDLAVPVNITVMVGALLDIIHKECPFTIDVSSIAYQRLLTHLRFALQRLLGNQPFHGIDQAIYDVIIDKCHDEFICAQKLRRYMEDEYKFTFPDAECAHLAMHIHQLSRLHQT